MTGRSRANRLPQPDFGATQGFASTVPSATINPNYVMRLGENPPRYGREIDQLSLGDRPCLGQTDGKRLFH